MSPDLDAAAHPQDDFGRALDHCPRPLAAMHGRHPGAVHLALEGSLCRMGLSQREDVGTAFAGEVDKRLLGG